MFAKQRIYLIFCLLMFWVFTWPVGDPLKASNPANVGLVSFDLTPLDNAVQIEWVTATEIGTAAFMIQRGTNNQFEFLEEIGLIPSEGGPQIGATYEVVDETAVNGQTYTYKLIEVEQSSSQNEVASATVTAGIPPTATSIVISSGDEQGAATNTPIVNTATPTRTPTPTLAAPTAANTPNQPTAVPATSSGSINTPAPTTPATTVPPTPTTAFVQPTTQPPPDPNVIQALEESPAPTIQVIAQTEPTTAALPTPAAYPGQLIEPTPDPAVPTAYPAASDTPLPTVAGVPIIGSTTQIVPETTAVSQAEPMTAAGWTGIGFLWGGFILALLIFMTAVIGSILFFARRK